MCVETDVKDVTGQGLEVKCKLEGSTRDGSWDPQKLLARQRHLRPALPLWKEQVIYRDRQRPTLSSKPAASYERPCSQRPEL